jgi:hypothetical protein
MAEDVVIAGEAAIALLIRIVSPFRKRSEDRRRKIEDWW